MPLPLLNNAVRNWWDEFEVPEHTRHLPTIGVGTTRSAVAIKVEVNPSVKNLSRLHRLTLIGFHAMAGPLYRISISLNTLSMW